MGAKHWPPRTMVAALLKPNQLAPMRTRVLLFSSRMVSSCVDRAMQPLPGLERATSAMTRRRVRAPMGVWILFTLGRGTQVDADPSCWAV